MFTRYVFELVNVMHSETYPGGVATEGLGGEVSQSS